MANGAKFRRKFEDFCRVVEEHPENFERYIERSRESWDARPSESRSAQCWAFDCEASAEMPGVDRFRSVRSELDRMVLEGPRSQSANSVATSASTSCATGAAKFQRLIVSV
ncbi:unnamed protein product [Effrenium voratum]|nr:unnamed protein product [Effrenium voratum]